MADRADGLAGLGEGADEVGGRLIDPELVRIGDAARQHQGVVVAGLDLAEDPVDPDLVAGRQVVEALDLALLGRDDLDFGAGLLQSLHRLGELDLLEAVGGHDGDLLALKLSGHVGVSFRSMRCAPPGGVQHRSLPGGAHIN